MKLNRSGVMSCLEEIKSFKKKYPKTVAWRLYQNAKVVDDHVNPDEEILYAFVAQKNDSPFDYFTTTAVALTNKRILMGQKRVLFGYALNSITPDLFNDMQVYQGIIWGRITIDTVKETVTFTNIDKKALIEIETKISQFMMEEKKKYYEHKEN